MHTVLTHQPHLPEHMSEQFVESCGLGLIRELAFRTQIFISWVILTFLWNISENVSVDLPDGRTACAFEV